MWLCNLDHIPCVGLLQQRLFQSVEYTLAIKSNLGSYGYVRNVIKGW